VEKGIAGVVIKAYNASDVLIATQTTNASGNFTFPVGYGSNQVPHGTAVRLEYLLPDNDAVAPGFDFPGLSGAAYGSNVQFKTQSTSPVTVNFAISTPEQYRGTMANPKVFVPRHSNGNPLAAPAGNAAAEIALYAFNYTAAGQSNTGNNARTSLATAAQIGACWGVAYNPYNQRLYTSALIKRHTGLGPGGPAGSPSAENAPGSVYVANPAVSNSGAFFFSMDALGSSYYTHNHTAGHALNVRDNVSRGLNKDVDNPSADAAAFDQVGKTGIGDLEMSADGRYMWLTNLYDRKVYRIDLTSASSPVAPTAATAATVVTGYSLPALTCTNGVLRPWALKWYRGKIYVGVVCTGENDANANNTANTSTNYDGTSVGAGSFNTGNAYILALNPAGAGSWTTVLTIPLSYPRGNTADENFNITRWFNWTNNFNVLKAYPSNTSGALIRPQPILSNIEFDTDGSLMIGFTDRTANQSGKFQPDVNGASSYYGESGGDLLRAYCHNGVYELESNGKEGHSSTKTATSGKDRGQGPGSGSFPAGAGSSSGNVNGAGYGTNYGEFYHNDRFWYQPGPYWAHSETSLGGLAFLPGSNEITTTSMDPFDIYSSGVNKFSNNTGDSTGRYEIVAPAEAGTFAKASSLGDIEIMAPLPAIEIGNRVWYDANGNGLQDAGETGMPGVEMELLNSSGTVIAAVTTAADGTYYFSSSAGTHTTGITYNINLLPNTSYTVRVKGTVGASNVIIGNAGLGSSYFTTFAKITGNGIPGLSDSDGIVSSGSYQATIT
ncbi:MAG: hypothetical protein JNM68_07055, partial [Dinghuibacter sp.]|nr:hypothetical protein [Dinghuibacter sp.]